MNRDRRWRGLLLQLFVLIVLPLTALTIIIAFGSLALHQRAMRSLVGERDQRAVRAAATAITEQLKHRAAAVQGIALQAAAVESPEEALADAAFLLPDFEGGLALLAPDGTALAASNPVELWQARAISQRLAGSQQASGSAGDARFLTPFPDPATGEPLMLVAAAADGDVTAVGAFYPASLARQALTGIFSPGDEASVLVVDPAGLLLYQMGVQSEAEDLLEGHPGVAEALRGESGTTYLAAEEGEHVVAFSPVLPVGWALVIEESWQAVADPLLRTTEAAPLILAPVLVVALLALWFGVRQIVQPLQLLQQRAAELGWGNFRAIEEPVGGIEEIRRLQAELAHMAEKVKAAQQGLRSYLGAVTAGQEEERRRLARELHDDTLQSLIALNQRVQLAQLAEAQAMTAQIIADLRRFTHALRPTYLEDLGLVPALDMLARDTSQSLGIPVAFEMAGPERRQRPEVELALYRIAQEALSNVARHSQASRAEVHLDFAPEGVTLTISDDGRGFTVPESPVDLASAGHFGLLGLHERAELIGARLAIESQPGQGTRLAITLPLAGDRLKAPDRMG